MKQFKQIFIGVCVVVITASLFLIKEEDRVRRKEQEFKQKYDSLNKILEKERLIRELEQKLRAASESKVDSLEIFASTLLRKDSLLLLENRRIKIKMKKYENQTDEELDAVLDSIYNARYQSSFLFKPR